MYTHTLFHLIYLKLAFRQWECFLFFAFFNRSRRKRDERKSPDQWILRFRNAEDLSKGRQHSSNARSVTGKKERRVKKNDRRERNKRDSRGEGSNLLSANGPRPS